MLGAGKFHEILPAVFFTMSLVPRAAWDKGVSGQVLCAQAWKPGSQHAGEKRGVAGLYPIFYLAPLAPRCPRLLQGTLGNFPRCL